MGLFTRIFRRAAPELAVRSFDAATGRRPSLRPTFGDVRAEVSAAAMTVGMRARHAAANNPYVANAVGNFVAALVGSGITPTSADATAVATFLDWEKSADAAGRTNLPGLLAQACRAMIVDGEALLHVSEVFGGVRVRHIPAEHLARDVTRDLAGGGWIFEGVEFDQIGRVVAYWVSPRAPTSAFETWAPPVRFDATQILHLMRPIGAGQVRGISWLAPLLLPAAELDGLTDALVVSAKVRAMHVGILSSLDGQAEQYGSDPELSPGAVVRLSAGEQMTFNAPTPAVETGALATQILRQMAAGLGIPEHLVSGDLTGANYSSLRAGLLPFRQRVEQIQYDTLVPQVLDPLWRAVTGGAAPVEWLMPRPPQVDPLKDTAATVAEIEAGLTSRRKAVAERGWNIADLDAEISADTFTPKGKSDA